MTPLQTIYEQMTAPDPVDGLRKLIYNTVPQGMAQIETDRLGNVTVTQGGTGRAVMLVCSVAVPQLVLTKISEEGKIRFACTPPCPVEALLYAPVRFSTDGWGIIRSDGKNAPLSLKDLYIDAGFSDTQTLRDSVKLYSFSSIEMSFRKEKDIICGRFLSNLLPMGIFLEIIKRVNFSDKHFNFTFLFAPQPATKALFKSEIPYLLTLQCVEEAEGVSCHAGCGIVLKSKHSVLSPALKDRIFDIAASQECLYQIIVSHENICGLDRLELLQGGALHAGFAIPVRGFRSPVETVSEKDVEKTIDLLLKILYQL